MVKGTVLVTGANGFIGRHLCRHLMTKGYTVIAALRQHQEGPWHQVRIVDFSTVIDPDIAKDVDSIFHLASVVHARGTDDALYQQVNVEGSAQLLASGSQHNVARFVYFSSIKVAGETTMGCIDEDANLAPQTLYGQSKLKAEQLVLAAQGYTQKINLRLAPVYGEGMVGSLHRLQLAINKGWLPRLPQTDNRRSFVHVMDVVNACDAILESPKVIEKSYFIAEPHHYSISQIEKFASRGQPMSRLYFPQWVWRLMANIGTLVSNITGKTMPFEQLQYDAMFTDACYRGDLFNKDFGFTPQYQLSHYLSHVEVIDE